MPSLTQTENNAHTETQEEIADEGAAVDWAADVDTIMDTLPEVQGISMTIANAQGIPSPPGTQAGGKKPMYPLSDQGDTPPQFTVPQFHREDSPHPPHSPFLYPRTVVNTPQPATLTDLDVTMAPKPTQVAPSPTTVEETRATTTISKQQAPRLVNALGLTTLPETPQSAKKPTVFDRLEEAANDNASNGKHPARNTIDKYSLGPMPDVQDATPISIFDNIHLATIKEWDLSTGGKLIAVPFDSDARFPESHEFLRTRILTAVAEIITTQEISVAAPKPSEKAAIKNRTPTSFLIYNISIDQQNFLLQRKVWSSKAITFRVAPFATTCPNFLFTIKDFSTTVMKDVFEMVRTVWDNEETINLVATLINDAPADERTKARHDVQNFLASLSISRLDIKIAGNTLLPHFNVYAESNNFTCDRIWSCLRAHLLAAAYISPIQGRATTEKAPFRCSCCHGVDHPRGLCPFPSLPGWNGPKRDSGDTQRRNGGSPYSDKRSQRMRYTPRT